MSDVINRAIELGIDELGLSDHLTLHPDGRIVKWSMRPDQLPKYVESILAERERVRSKISVRVGLELDWFEGQEAPLRRIVETYPFDYVIGSVHFVGAFGVDGYAKRWEKLSQDDVDELHQGYWRRVESMASSGLFTIAAHLDLPKKFGYLPRAAPREAIDAALDAIASAGLVVELNTAGWHKVCAEAYPAKDILARCLERGIATTISSDAHNPADLLRDFERAAALLREVGFQEIARFEGGAVRMEPLDRSVVQSPSSAASSRVPNL